MGDRVVLRRIRNDTGGLLGLRLSPNFSLDSVSNEDPVLDATAADPSNMQSKPTQIPLPGMEWFRLLAHRAEIGSIEALEMTWTLRQLPSKPGAPSAAMPSVGLWSSELGRWMGFNGDELVLVPHCIEPRPREDS